MTKLHKNTICYHRELEYYFLECTYTEYNILSKRLCKICKIKPSYLYFQWLIGLSSIYVAKQRRTKWNHQKKNLTFQWLCLILYLYKQFLRLGQNLPLSYSLFMLCLLSFTMLCFLFFFKDMHYNTMVRTFCIVKKMTLCFS